MPEIRLLLIQIIFLYFDKDKLIDDNVKPSVRKEDTGVEHNMNNLKSKASGLVSGRFILFFNY